MVTTRSGMTTDYNEQAPLRTPEGLRVVANPTLHMAAAAAAAGQVAALGSIDSANIMDASPEAQPSTPQEAVQVVQGLQQELHDWSTRALLAEGQLQAMEREVETVRA